MQIKEKQLIIPAVKNHENLLEYIPEYIKSQLSDVEVPVRFVITGTDVENYYCEIGILSGVGDFSIPIIESIFNFRKRSFENTEEFNAVLLVPTGIGAEIGGHSGDAGPIARLIASACDNLITHPNVVNAADINELPENCLYVEGSVITRLLMGSVALQKVRSNRVMLVIDEHDQDKFFHEAAINSASAARAAFGLDCPAVIKMSNKMLMRSLYADSGTAVGRIEYFERLCEVLEEHRSLYDAVALSSVIQVPEHFHSDYFNDEYDIVNPWGGVEAMLTHAVSSIFNVPSAHSPMMNSMEVLDIDVGVVDPRKSAEAVSSTFLHCILKGLHKSPRIVRNPSLVHNPQGLLRVEDISCLIIPYGCVGLPTLAAIEQGIPVIAVRENKNRMQNRLEDFPFTPGKLFLVDNYLEAVGVMHALKAGVSLESVRRPLNYTNVIETNKEIQNRQELKAQKNG